MWRARGGEAYVETHTYYPDEERKPASVVMSEIDEAFTHGKGGRTAEETLETYLLYGIDRKSAKLSDYILQEEFFPLQGKRKPDYCHILDNKIFTLVYLGARGVSVSHILGQVNGSGLFVSMDNTVRQNFVDWLQAKNGPVFCKQPDGYRGLTCFVLEPSPEGFRKNGELITNEQLTALSPHLQVEQVITQHPDLNRLYSTGVSSFRIVTASDGKRQHFLSGYCLVGCGGNRISNANAGGIMVPFTPDGELGEFGVRELKYGGGKFYEHPDTHVRFAGFRIPFFREMQELAVHAHSMMDGIGSIGWDLAVTPDGPLIIEGNQCWGPLGHQALYGGRRELFQSALG